MTALNQNYQLQIRALANHDLFKQLSGNPLSIRILAAFNANSMLENNDLVSIYNKVKNEVNELAGDEKSVNALQSHENVMGNAISLRLSTEASVQLLRDTVP